ncbi:hypothetical protein EYF80_055456 [Liparis tanakae]|uniref:Secreted protein n=1 Tax=Liparis tanakae TaxID=230148 RepID=A0A4Z2EZU7_9TELE|nr:hypothetical protein EYF80_055456 [Liparis tanakae]
MIPYLAILSSIFSFMRWSVSFFMSSSCSFWRMCCSSWPCLLRCFSRSSSSARSRSRRSACFTRISSSSLETVQMSKATTSTSSGSSPSRCADPVGLTSCNSISIWNSSGFQWSCCYLWWDASRHRASL